MSPITPSITLDQYLMGRDKQYPPTPTMLDNARYLLSMVNPLLEEAHDDGVRIMLDSVTKTRVASGYRPAAINDRTANAAKGSAHQTCEAVDIQDTVNRDLARWCLRNLKLLEKIDLYMEDPRWTWSASGDHWVHLQSRPPKSGNTVFIPSSAPPPGPPLA